MSHAPKLRFLDPQTLIVDSNWTKQRIRVCIPKRYQHEPIIATLIRQYNVMVNILAALLGADARDDGWFDLELQGQTAQISAALLYLDDLGLDIWQDTDIGDW